jgi:hypothetical protein
MESLCLLGGVGFECEEHLVIADDDFDQCQDFGAGVFGQGLLHPDLGHNLAKRL